MSAFEIRRYRLEDIADVYEGLQQMRLKVGYTAHDSHMLALLNPKAKRSVRDVPDGV